MSNLNFQRILVVSDGLKTSDTTHETTLHLAKEHGAKVKIVDTLKPPNAALAWFSPNASDVFEMVLADKQHRLEKIANQFRSAGVSTETEVLLGKSSEAITREAIAWDASLVVRYMKGVRSKFSGTIGNTARSLMRFCPTPLLLVGQSPVVQPNVLACIDTDHDDAENRSILDVSIKLAKQENLFGLYCWELYGREHIERRMNHDAFQESLAFAESLHQESFRKFVETHDLAMMQNMRMKNGDPSEIIPAICEQEGIDVVVMCSATLNHPLKRYFGSTVESVIESLPCSLLVVKPIGFVSPLGGRAAVEA